MVADVVGWGPLALNSMPGLALAVISQAIQAAAGIQQSRNCTPDVFVVAGRSRGGVERRGSGVEGERAALTALAAGHWQRLVLLVLEGVLGRGQCVRDSGHGSLW